MKTRFSSTKLLLTIGCALFISLVAAGNASATCTTRTLSDGTSHEHEIQIAKFVQSTFSTLDKTNAAKFSAALKHWVIYGNPKAQTHSGADDISASSDCNLVSTITRNLPGAANLRSKLHSAIEKLKKDESKATNNFSQPLRCDVLLSCVMAYVKY